MKLLVINGPNLSRLDIRDSSIYGDLNYPELKSMIEIAAQKHNFEADVRQSDDEATIIGWLHEAADQKIPVIINPAAFTHYSVISGVANGTIGGFGPNSYVLAIIAMQNLVSK